MVVPLANLKDAAADLTELLTDCGSQLDKSADPRGALLIEETMVTSKALLSLLGEIGCGNLPVSLFRKGGRSYWSHAVWQAKRDGVLFGERLKLKWMNASSLLALGVALKRLSSCLDELMDALSGISPGRRALSYCRNEVVVLRSRWDAYAHAICGVAPGKIAHTAIARVFYGEITAEQRLAFRRLCTVSSARRRMTSWRRDVSAAAAGA